ncbi:MAG: hypothetical protein HZB81_07015 [Deltaproteobacteria bacterium]|nr:hypothetical protein [Deltaproteobacteria bacterium]
MSDIGKKGRDYVKKHFGELTSGHITVSQFYDDITKKSFAHSPSWGNEIPPKNLKENEDVHIICEHENGDGFYYFRVPVKDIKDMLERSKLGFNKDNIALHLSAQPDSLFQDLRGEGKIDFSRYLQKQRE